LQFANDHRRSAFPETPDILSEVLSRGYGELESLHQQFGQPIHSRRRPRRGPSYHDECAIFLDECGTHALTSKEIFNAFAIAAVLIQQSNFQEIEDRWRRWKIDVWGSGDVQIHEPDVRRGTGPFHFGGDAAKRLSVLDSLDALISELEFRAVVTVLRRKEYRDSLGERAKLDASLPEHPYHMVLDFVCERLVMALDSEFGGMQGRLFFESREKKEDALLQREFVRLHVDGTSYISSAWFRQQLIPGIVFRTKHDQVAGLELADLLARACAEKVLDPQSTPTRWTQFREKLCPTVMTKNSPLGIKVVPWSEDLAGFWQS
jgi:hypothetical protein